MKKRMVRNTAVLLSLVILFLSMGFSYVRFVERLLVTEAESHLRAVAEQTAQSAESKLHENIETLRALSVNAEKLRKVSANERAAYLQNIVGHIKLQRIGFAELSGQAVTSDGMTFNVSDRDYFLKASAGQEWISDPFQDVTDVYGTIIVFAVPVYEQEQIVAVLFGVYDLSTLAQWLDLSFFEESGKVYVVQGDGEVMIRPKESGQQVNITDIIDPKQQKQIETVKADLLNGHTDTEKLDTLQREIYACIAPIDIGKVWNVVAVVDAGIVTKNLQTVIVSTILMICWVVLLFLIGAAYYLWNKHRSEKKLYQLAFIDSLTGIPNKNKLLADGEKYFGTKACAILYLDIDNFTMINDIFGYAFGDDILRMVAGAIKENAGENSHYGRLGNDSFALILPETERKTVIGRLENIFMATERLWDEEKVKFEIVLSVGVYLKQAGERDLENALNKANIARGFAKRSGERQYVFYEADMHEERVREMELQSDIVQAIKKKQFQVYYQPKFLLKTGEMIGCEALLRWNHPDKGWISPAVFIPVAEQSQLIAEIGNLVYETVCADLRGWLDQGKKVKPVSVNLSRVELFRSDLMENILKYHRAYDIPPQLIEIELTESTALKDIAVARNVIASLKEEGFTVSMDDFGKGYSSVECLEELPIDILKLDKAFADKVEVGEKGKNIARAMIALAKSLGLEVTIEGVENESQAEFFRGTDCDYVQGFYYAKPVGKSEMERWLA